jgi:hypothetical protein
VLGKEEKKKMALMPDADFEGDFLEVQENIGGIANAASAVLLPLRSKERYEKQYAIFCEWRKAKGANGVNEDLILAYLYENVS